MSNMPHIQGFFATMTGMKRSLIEALAKAVAPLGIDESSIRLEYPEDPSYGDFSSNVAMANAKKLGEYCAGHPDIGLITATDKLFQKE